jgi:hypothetical protein
MVTKPIEAKWRSLAMDLNTFIVAVFCLIDERIKGRRLRQRGPAPKLSDSEVLTFDWLVEQCNKSLSSGSISKWRANQ